MREPPAKPSAAANQRNLGHCSDPRCGGHLVVRQRAKYRLVRQPDGEEQRVLLTEDGKDLKQDQSGRTNGKPALEWLVICPDCNKEHRQHEYQRVLDAHNGAPVQAPQLGERSFMSTQRQTVTAGQLESELLAKS